MEGFPALAVVTIRYYKMRKEIAVFVGLSQRINVNLSAIPLSLFLNFRMHVFSSFRYHHK